MRLLTEEEMEKIRCMRKSARLSVAALEQRCGLRSHKIAECIRGRVRLSEEEIACIFANLVTSQPIEADQGQRMLCTTCKKNLTAPGVRKCAKCRNVADYDFSNVHIGGAVVELNGQPIPSQEEAQMLEHAKKLAGMVTPLYDALTALRTEVFERFAQAENASVANANFAESLYERINAFSHHENTLKGMAGDVQELHNRVTELARAVAKPNSADEASRAQEPDIIVSFVNFERICRQMHAKCPHLFAASVRRACGGA